MKVKASLQSPGWFVLIWFWDSWWINMLFLAKTSDQEVLLFNLVNMPGSDSSTSACSHYICPEFSLSFMWNKEKHS